METHYLLPSKNLKMRISLALLCFSCILHSSTYANGEAQKFKPVALAYSCMRAKSDGGIENTNTPIILFHGLGGAKEIWSGIYQVLALKTNRKVCIADLRNHGDSPWSHATSVAAMAEDISLLLETLKVPKVILLGHSLGGKVAMHFTLTNPNKVEKLIVEDMRPNGLPAQALKNIQFLLKLLTKSLSAIPEGANEDEAKLAVALYIKKKLASNSGLVDKRAVQFLPIVCLKGKCRWKTNTELFDLITKDPLSLLTESKGRYDGPTLFIYGTKSPFKVNEDENSIRKLFPKSELVGVEGAEHAVHNHPKYLDEVVKFINASPE